MHWSWKSKKIWRTAAILALIFILHFSGLFRPLEDYFFVAMKPLGLSFHGIGSWFRSDANEDSNVLRSQIDELRSRLARSAVDRAKLELVSEENEKLRKQIGFLDNNHYKAITANVVSRQILFEEAASAQDIILDKGEKDGLRSGLGVVNEDGVIVGKIVEVKDYSSRACLTTALDCQLPVAILNSDKTIGLSEGEMGLTIRINYIPQMEEIATEDIVISSGLGGNIPRGLVVGSVSQVNKQSNEIWQDVSIEPSANLADLSIVSVIIP